MTLQLLKSRYGNQKTVHFRQLNVHWTGPGHGGSAAPHQKVQAPQRAMALPVLLLLAYFRQNGPYEANTNHLIKVVR